MGIMDTLTHKTWNLTCGVCATIRNVLIAFWVGAIAMGETAGRARAAAELHRQGYTKEAKTLMAGRDIDETN
jgi:hypothetical protein